MRVLIIGAGVGGLATAQGLVADGHQVTVFEQARALSRGGAAVTVWPNGGTALADLGLTLVGAGRRIRSLEARSSTGRTLTVLDVARLADRLGTPVVTLPRRLLLDRLSADLPPGVVRFRARCVGVSVTGGRAEALFEDGSTAEGDVLIGADGHHSAVRKALSVGEPAVPTGRATWQGLSPIPIDLTAGRQALTFTGPEGDGGLMPAGDGLLHWWFDLPWTPGDPPPASPMAELRRRFGGWADPVPQVLAAAGDSEVEIFPHHRHHVPSVWGDGPCTLLGDSVHVMSPLPAQGASQALEDAGLLVRSLRGASADVTRALRAYERARQCRVSVVSWLTAHPPARQEGPPKALGQLPEPFTTWGWGSFLRAVRNRPAT